MCGVVILTTVDVFKLEFISIRFTTFFTSTKISNTKKHQISTYRRFENVSLVICLLSVGGTDNTKNKIPINNFQEMCTFVASRHETL